MSVRNQRPAQAGVTTYRSSTHVSLLPWQVSDRRFSRTPLGRRGLDPDEVYAFLARVASDLAGMHAALQASRRETAVIKDALRQWQSQQVRTAHGSER